MAKTLIISDLHLSHKFDKKQYKKLVNIFESADKIILNGDFWDDSKTTFEQFVKSKWKLLFPLLKKKKAVYIFGNHDPSYNNDDTSIFSEVASDMYEIQHNNEIYLVTHGQLFSKTTLLSMYLKKNFPILYKLCVYPLRNMMKNSEKHTKNRKNKYWQRKLNQKFKKRMKDKGLIMGHTHVPEIDHENKYFNSGFCKDGFMSYLLLEDNKKPKLHRTTY